MTSVGGVDPTRISVPGGTERADRLMARLELGLAVLALSVALALSLVRH